MDSFSTAAAASSSLLIGMAQKTWELEINILPMNTAMTILDPASDAIFYYDEAVQANVQQEKPWANDPHYFKRVKISSLALLKMVVHARSGGTIEVKGLMQGKTDGDAIIVMDAFALQGGWRTLLENGAAEKLEQAENQLAHSRFGPLIAPPPRKKEEERQLAKTTSDSAKITVEQVHGLMSQVIKYILFNSEATLQISRRAIRP